MSFYPAVTSSDSNFGRHFELKQPGSVYIKNIVNKFDKLDSK